MSSIAPDYDYRAMNSANPVQRWWKNRIANTVWDWLPPSMSLENKILDIGGGSSPIIQAYHRAWMIDFDYTKVLWSQKNGHLGIQCFLMDATHLEFTEASFDYVLCIEVLEHIPDYGKAIREIARMLKPGGKAIIATPDYSTWQWRLTERVYKMLWPGAYCSDHVSQLDRTELKYQFALAGMQERRYIRVAGADYVGIFQKPYGKLW